MTAFDLVKDTVTDEIKEITSVGTFTVDRVNLAENKIVVTFNLTVKESTGYIGLKNVLPA